MKTLRANQWEINLASFERKQQHFNMSFACSQLCYDFSEVLFAQAGIPLFAQLLLIVYATLPRDPAKQTFRHLASHKRA